MIVESICFILFIGLLHLYVNIHRNVEDLPAVFFILGCIVTLSIMGFVSDFMGKDQYIEYIKNNWMDTHTVAWVILCAYALYLYGKKYIMYKKDIKKTNK